jgi:large repetitive protein
MGPLAGRRVRAVFGAALIVGSLSGSAITSQSVAAATPPPTVTLYVSASGPATRGCTSAAAPCQTILEGVTAAEVLTGDAVTITVAAGTYPGGVTIAASELASLTIEGAGASTTNVTGRGLTRDFDLTMGTVTVSGLTITGGSSPEGGGLFAYDATTTVTDDIFSDDHASTSSGGALFGHRGTVTMTDDTFSGDTASSTGGAVTEATGTATMTDDTFSGDRAGTTGGAVTNAAGIATMSDDTFSNDTATHGSGVYNDNGNVTMTDDTFSDDRSTTGAGGVGGGIFNIGTAAMTDDTFWNDGLTIGGAIYNEGTATVNASILDASSCISAGTGKAISGTYDIATTTTCAHLGKKITPDTLDLTTTLKPNTSTGPETLALGPTSPAIDEVPQKACTTKTDERGKTRPGDKAREQRRCDAGAYELQHTASTLIQGTPRSGTVTHGRTATFQLAVTNPLATTGKVRFAATSDSVPPGVTVASTGMVSVAATTMSGSYTLAGTDTDPLHDAGSWTFDLDVTGYQAPAITSSSSAHFIRGTPGTFTITATGTPEPKLTKRDKLPKGLSFTTEGNGTATISGTAYTVASVEVTITATNGIAPKATQKLTIAVGIPPKFTSAATATFTPEVANSFTVTSSGTPAPSITESGKLPKGVSFATKENGTATISGKPKTSTAGAYGLTFTATNGFGKAATQKFTLTVN